MTHTTEAGRVEVYIDNSWGGICGTGFDQTAATVACRSLGYKYGTVS